MTAEKRQVVGSILDRLQNRARRLFHDFCRKQSESLDETLAITREEIEVWRRVLQQAEEDLDAIADHAGAEADPPLARAARGRR